MSDRKEIWDEYPEVWKTKSAFMSWIRGGIRRSLWNRHPVKLLFIKKNRVRIPNPNKNRRFDTVWGAKCAITGELLPLNLIEVDHKSGGHSLRDLSDVNSFVNGIVNVRLDDLQFVSKKIHKVKSYAENRKLSLDDAILEKKAIEIVKQKQDVEFFKSRNIQRPSNQKERRLVIVKILKSEMLK